MTIASDINSIPCDEKICCRQIRAQSCESFTCKMLKRDQTIVSLKLLVFNSV